MNKRKFNNTTVFDGEEKFDSKKEYERWKELQLMERAGVISNLKRQVKFVLFEKSKHGRERSYIADFCYWLDGQYVVEDVKSKATKTQLYLYKKRHMAEKYEIVILET